MTSVEMDLGKYLSRIGYSGPVEPSLDVLRSVHLSHLLSVPFENLTTHSGGRIHLDKPLLYDKIVNGRRGGVCYENNGLFSWLLTELGFQVTVLSGQVKGETGLYGPPFDHFINMVSLDGRRWLCDVGFGGAGFSVPLSLDTNGSQEQGHRAYRIREDDTGMRFVEWQQEEIRGPDGDWVEIYKFTLQPRRAEEFEEMSLHHQTSPCSLFFCKSLCTILKPRGRLTYIGRTFKNITFPAEGTGGKLEITTRELKDEEIQGMLAEQFGIVLNSPLIPKDETVAPLSIIY